MRLGGLVTMSFSHQLLTSHRCGPWRIFTFKSPERDLDPTKKIRTIFVRRTTGVSQEPKFIVDMLPKAGTEV